MPSFNRALRSFPVRNDRFNPYRNHFLRGIKENEAIDGFATRREIIFSVFIIGCLIALGCWCHNSIVRAITDHNLKVEQTIQITSNDQFKHCLDTSAGDVYAEGDLDSVDPVKDEKGHVKGEFWKIVRDYQEYRMHTRHVTYTDSKGKSHTRIEHYWTWDTISSHTDYCKKATFCGVEFSTSKIDFNYWGDEHGPYKISGDSRYCYYTIPKHHHGTLVTSCKDGTITDGSFLHRNKTPIEVHDDMLMGSFVIYLFWFGALIAIGFIVYWFLMLNNRWLESNGSEKHGIEICS